LELFFFREISELKQVISTAHRESAELDNLTRDKSKLQNRCESLQKEVDNLRMTLNAAQTTSSTKESSLRDEVSILTSKIHRLEEELADVSSDMADASMPLSLEIEKLQKDLNLRQAQYEKRISSLQATISESELKLKEALDREKSAIEHNHSLQEKIAALEDALHSSEKDKSTIQSHIARQSEELLRLKTEHASKSSKFRDEILHLKNTIERVKGEKKQIEEDLKLERVQIETEKRKNVQLNDQFQKLHQKVGVLNSNPIGHSQPNGPNPHPITKSGENSPSNQSYTSEASYLDEVFDQGSRRSMTPKSFFDSFSTTNLVEALQAQLRIREGEVVSLQDQVHKNEKLRRTLNEEIAHLTLQNQELLLDKDKIDNLQTKLQEMEATYNALLQVSFYFWLK